MSQPTPTPGATRAAEEMWEAFDVAENKEFFLRTTAKIITKETGVAELLDSLEGLIDQASVQACVLKVNTPTAASLPDLLYAIKQARNELAKHRQNRKEPKP